MMTNNLSNADFFSKAVDLLYSARKQVIYSINHTMVNTYFQIGRMIIEEEQLGKKRAEYGKQLIKGLFRKAY